MPMDFPDFPSLLSAAEVHGFRDARMGESEENYRKELADHVAPRDLVESEEIRNKVGWDRFTDEQNMDMLKRNGARIYL